MTGSSAKRRAALGAAHVVLLIVLMAGCAASRQPRGAVEKSGFLGDYSQLEPGKSGQAKLVYIAPGVDWSRYRSVQLDSVTLWPGKDGTLAKLSPAVQQQLADRLYKALYDALAKQNRMVTGAGAGVLRVRAALTEASPTNVPLNAVATVIPQVRALSTVTGLGADTALTVGEATAEVEASDSLTGRRLAAAVDRRVGQRSLRGLGTWSQVDAAFAAWGQQFAARLASLRAESGSH